MLNRYPDQAASRKGYALTAVLLLVFGVAMAIFEVAFVAAVALASALALLLPSLCCGHSAFAQFERALSRLFAGW